MTHDTVLKLENAYDSIFHISREKKVSFFLSIKYNFKWL